MKTTIRKKDQYTAGDIAFLYGVAHRTACKMIDDGMLKGHRAPTRNKERRVLHHDLMAHAHSNFGNFSYVLDKIEGLTDEERANS